MILREIVCVTEQPSIGVGVRTLHLPQIHIVRLSRPTENDVHEASAAFGIDLPLTPNKWSAATPATARLGPGEWLVWDAPNAGLLAEKAASIAAAVVTPITSGQCGWRISGPKAARLLVQGCSLDLEAFLPGTITRTLFAQCHAIISRFPGADALDLIADRSHGHYFATWLADAQQAIQTNGDAVQAPLSPKNRG